eukprot:542934-Pyramimonas_sp.AAC.1
MAVAKVLNMDAKYAESLRRDACAGARAALQLETSDPHGFPEHRKHGPELVAYLMGHFENNVDP